VFGLFATYSWNPDIPATVPAERMTRVRRIIGEARKRELKLILGMGVYSWGFDAIIAHDPDVRRTSQHAMCLSSEKSWVWMRDILNYVLDNFDFDGYHLESSDLGRCSCEKCQAYTNVEYYSLANKKCADYIEAKKPGLILMVNMSMYLRPGECVQTESDFQAIVDLSRSIDYLIDGGHFGFFLRGEYRERAFKELRCSFGSSGERWVYMPQRWDKLRWFLPTLNHNCAHIKEMNTQGGDAIEFYMGATVNPGVEMNILCAGKMLCDPSRDVSDVLREAIHDLYQPDSRETCEALARVFLYAEASYYGNVNLEEIPGFSNELLLEPLLGTEPGPPLYLMEKGKCDFYKEWMNAEGRSAYMAELTKILFWLEEIDGKAGDTERLERIKTCVRNTVEDIRRLQE
jgi:hypothetical protein